MTRDGQLVMRQVDEFPYNAGVMLMNLPLLRSTYNDFLDFILGNRHSMYFPGYGPGDQGAINQFYEAYVRKYKLPQVQGNCH
jgi:hypothetical protein